MLGRAANDMSAAAGPIREASGSIRDAVGRTQDLLARAAEAGARQQAAIETVTGSLERTGTAATQAWTDYRARFDAVDQALERALTRIQSASAEHAATLNNEVGRMDKALADAVDRLGTALDDVRGRFQDAAE